MTLTISKPQKKDEPSNVLTVWGLITVPWQGKAVEPTDGPTRVGWCSDSSYRLICHFSFCNFPVSSVARSLCQYGDWLRVGRPACRKHTRKIPVAKWLWVARKNIPLLKPEKFQKHAFSPSFSVCWVYTQALWQQHFAVSDLASFAVRGPYHPDKFQINFF